MNKCDPSFFLTFFDSRIKMLTDQQLKVKRDVERMDAIAKGLIHDPNKPRALSEAIHFQGTCLDMCPEFEMHQREYQNNVEKFEIVLILMEELKLISRILHRVASVNSTPSKRFIVLRLESINPYHPMFALHRS
jgi:hypothetical protein